ncbi:MAG: pyridoxal phosphate-dependent aminotransferase [Acidilobaceae archaeon]
MSLLRVSVRASSLRPSPTLWLYRLVGTLKSRGLDYYSLHVGQPSFTPPRDLMVRFLEVISSRVSDLSLYSYTSPWGLLELREAIALDLAQHGRVRADPLGEVVVTSGGIEGLLSALASILDPGDPVGFIVPAYFHFYSIARLLGLRVVELPVYPELELKADPLVDLFSRVKAIVIANPDNPTGRVLDEGVARLVADLACDRGVYVVHDIAYYTLRYEAGMAWPENYCRDYIVTVGTYSKDPGVPGWRVGFIVAPADVAEAVAHVREATSYNTPVPSQILILEYLRGGFRAGFLPRVLEEYSRRRSALIEALKEELPKAYYYKPKTGIFVYVNLEGYTRVASDKLVERLALEDRVLAVPGTLFGPGGESWLRLSFAVEGPERLREAVRMIARRVRGVV